MSDVAPSDAAHLEGLPAPVAAVLSGFLAKTREALSADLVSAVLFGSAVDGTLGSTSDINLLLVLRAFSPDRIELMRDAIFLECPFEIILLIKRGTKPQMIYGNFRI